MWAWEGCKGSSGDQVWRPTLTVLCRKRLRSPVSPPPSRAGLSWALGRGSGGPSQGLPTHRLLFPPLLSEPSCKCHLTALIRCGGDMKTFPALLLGDVFCPSCTHRERPASWGTDLSLAALPMDGCHGWEAALGTPRCSHRGRSSDPAQDLGPFSTQPCTSTHPHACPALQAK